VRTHTVKSITYLSLVENLWNPVTKSYKQKRIAALGKASDITSTNRIEKVITALHCFCEKNGISSLSNGIILTNKTSEDFVSKTYDYGIYRLGEYVLGILGIAPFLVKIIRNAPGNLISSQKAISALEALVSHHLIPRTDASERGTHTWYTDQLFIPGKRKLSLMDFYRTLDILLAHKDEIENAYFEANRDLFSQSLDLVLFDTTSIYYFGAEDFPSDEAGLLQYGFSKDGKSNLKQVIVGILMTKDGVPIAHEVFPGNMADVTSFSLIVGKVKKKYRLNQVILVADRGMVSEENLLTLEEMQIGYIMGIRMRILPAELSKILLDDLEPEEMEKVNDHLYTKQYHLSHFSKDRLKRFFLDGILRGKKKKKLPTFDEEKIMEHLLRRRMFVFLNPFVAKKTIRKREAFKRILKKKISSTPDKDWVIKNGYRKYLSFEGGINPVLDEEKLEGESLFDGKWILMTNDPEVSPVEAGKYYQTLQFVERGFKDLKSLISIRPVFHFKEERIKAHIFVSFLTLVVKWYILRAISEFSQSYGRRFIAEMINLKAILVDKSLSLYMRTEINAILSEGMKKLGMKQPEKIIFEGKKDTFKKEISSIKAGRPKKKDENQLFLSV